MTQPRDQYFRVPGRRQFINRQDVAIPSSGGSGFTPNNTLFVDPDGLLTSFNGAAYTTIQSALDAANALTPSNTDRYLVWVAPGTYDENLTLYQWVSLYGMSDGVRVTLGGGSGNCIDSVDNVTIKDITFSYNGQTGQTALLSTTHEDFRLVHCHFSGTPSGVDWQFGAGKIDDCTFDNTDVRFAGSSEASHPVFTDCRKLDGTFSVSATTSYGEWNGGEINRNVDGSWGTITSKNVTFTGVRISASDECTVSFAGRMVGCNLYLHHGDLNSEVPAMTVSGGSTFVGCNFVVGSTFGDANGVFNIGSVAGRDVVFDGCHMYVESKDSIFFFTTSITGDTGRLILTGNTIIGRQFSFNGSLFEVDSAGFSGDMVVELNGNYLQTSQNTLPTNPGTGTLRWRGSDIDSVFHPVSIGVGTGGDVVDTFPVKELDLATENAYITGRINPPASILVDAQLVLSCINSDGIHTDTFTDTDGTLLSAHASDSGGSWTNVSGTITIQTNRGEDAGSGTVIYTYSVGASNGFLRCTFAGGSYTFGTNRAAIIFRYADTSNYWRLEHSDDDGGRLIKRVAGSDTVVLTSISSANAVSFDGDHIRIWNSSNKVVAEVYDSDLESNTVVGLHSQNVGGNNNTFDDFEFHPGGTVDLTLTTSHGKLGEPFQTEAASDDDGVHTLHKAYSFHDIPDIGGQESIWGLEVDLDVLNGNVTDVHVHGVMTRHLRAVVDEFTSSGDQPNNGIHFA